MSRTSRIVGLSVVVAFSALCLWHLWLDRRSVFRKTHVVSAAHHLRLICAEAEAWGRDRYPDADIGTRWQQYLERLKRIDSITMRFSHEDRATYSVSRVVADPPEQLQIWVAVPNSHAMKQRGDYLAIQFVSFGEGEFPCYAIAYSPSVSNRVFLAPLNGDHFVKDFFLQTVSERKWGKLFTPNKNVWNEALTVK